jgi:hypothetical protein
MGIFSATSYYPTRNACLKPILEDIPGMAVQVYPSDLTDAEWALASALLPATKPGGRPRSVDVRRILNGLFYLVRAGCAWRYLPRGHLAGNHDDAPVATFCAATSAAAPAERAQGWREGDQVIGMVKEREAKEQQQRQEPRTKEQQPLLSRTGGQMRSLPGDRCQQAADGQSALPVADLAGGTDRASRYRASQR